MPWTTIEQAKKHNKSLTDPQAKIWLKVANSALDRCLLDGKGQDFCEGSAIRQANKVASEALHNDVLESIKYDDNGDMVVIFASSDKETFTTEAEIFAAGQWNKDNYTIKDLDDMVEAFGCLKSKWRPYLKLGHNDKITGVDQPALGYVDKLKRVGEKLVATITNIPKTIKDAVEKGLYGKRSCEIFWNYNDEGKKYPRVLKAIALLGASVPAVTSLKDIEKFFDVEYVYEDCGNYDEVREYEVDEKQYVKPESITRFAMEMKTDDGVEYPKEAYLYVPDPEKPSTWKLRIWEDPEKKVTVAQLGRVAAAFSPGGFRGQKVDLPADEVKKIKQKLISLYKIQKIKEEDIPQHLFNYEDQKGGMNMNWEEILATKENEIKELKEQLKKFEEEKNSAKIAELTQSIGTMETEIETLKEYKAKAEKAEKELAESKKSLAEKEKENAELRYKERESEVKLYVQKMGVQGEKKILPRDEVLVSQILMACPEEKLYSMEDKEEKFSLADMVREFISRQSVKIDTSQRSHKDKDEQHFENIGLEVDGKAKEYMAEHSGVTYYEAMKAVLAADPELKRRYWDSKKS